MKTEINSLPNEVLLKIMSQICIYDRINCRFVCVRWQGLATKLLDDEKAFHFGHHLRICGDSEHKVVDEKGLTYYYDKVGKLLDESSLMRRILELTPKLKSIHVYLRCERTIAVIMENCKDIECLTLISFDDRVMLSSVAMINKFGKTLRHLKICDESRAISRNCMEDVMANMLSYCPKLEIFHLFRIQLNGKSCSMISDSIKEISTQVGSNSIRALTRRTNYSNLENLIIRDSIINFNRLRLICSSFIHIKRLFIESYSDCDNFTEFSLIGQMSRLEQLEVNFIPKLYRQFISIDKELSNIFNGCRNLNKISFFNCINVMISNVSLIEMSTSCDHMKHIHFWKFGDMTKITIAGITALTALAKLEYLALDALHYSRNESLLKYWSQRLVDSNQSLKFIYLMDYQVATNA